MNLNLNFSAKTLLKDWYKQVQSIFTSIQTEFNKEVEGCNTHKTAATLDHPDSSVKKQHIAVGAVSKDKLNDDVHIPLSGICTTAQGTQNKVVECSDFKLYDGARIAVNFHNGNTAPYITLNVNNTGKIIAYFPIRGSRAYQNDDISKVIVGGCNYEFVYQVGTPNKWVYCGATNIPANGSVNTGSIIDGAITKPKLDTALQNQIDTMQSDIDTVQSDIDTMETISNKVDLYGIDRRERIFTSQLDSSCFKYKGEYTSGGFINVEIIPTSDGLVKIDDNAIIINNETLVITMSYGDNKYHIYMHLDILTNEVSWTISTEEMETNISENIITAHIGFANVTYSFNTGQGYTIKSVTFNSDEPIKLPYIYGFSREDLETETKFSFLEAVNENVQKIAVAEARISGNLCKDIKYYDPEGRLVSDSDGVKYLRYEEDWQGAYSTAELTIDDFVKTPIYPSKINLGIDFAYVHIAGNQCENGAFNLNESYIRITFADGTSTIHDFSSDKGEFISSYEKSNQSISIDDETHMYDFYKFHFEYDCEKEIKSIKFFIYGDNFYSSDDENGRIDCRQIVLIKSVECSDGTCVANLSDLKEMTSNVEECTNALTQINTEVEQCQIADTAMQERVDSLFEERAVEGVYNLYNSAGNRYDVKGLTAIPPEVFTEGYSTYVGGYYYVNGNYEANEWWWSIIIKCKPNTTYTNNSTTKRDNIWNVFDKDGNRIVGGQPSDGVYTTPANAAYLTYNTNRNELTTIAIIEGDTVPDIIKPYTENAEVKNVIKPDYYDMAYLNRLYGKGIYEGKKVLVLGDSNSALSGTELTDSLGDWKRWFSEYAKPKSVNCVAVGGATLCDKSNTVYDGNPVYNASDQSGNCFGNQVQKIINKAYETPDIIIVLYGMNDGAITLTDETVEAAFMTSYTGTGNVSLSDVDRKTFSGAFRYVNETLRKLYPEAVIVACTPIQQSQGARTYYKIMQTADSIKKLARRMSLPLWDTGGESGIYAAYGDYGTEIAYDLGDGLHTNGYGARKLGRYMAQKFIEIFGF